MFRIAVSSSVYRNSCTDPAKTDVWPPLSRRCRSRASGMPSKMAATAAGMNPLYHDLTYDAKTFGQYPQVTGRAAGRGPGRPGTAPAAARPAPGAPSHDDGLCKKSRTVTAGQRCSRRRSESRDELELFGVVTDT